MLSVIGFLLILAPLVVVHELGHYLFAILFKVKAEAFSIGFGPKLWSRQIGETEWRLSAIPLGGYVKLLGEDREAPMEPEEAKRALHRQAPWKRFLIFFGGPLFNFIFAIFVFMVILLIGEPQVSNVVGRVVHGSVAEQVGMKSGDRILSVNGKQVKKFDEILILIGDHPDQKTDLEIQHPESAQSTHIYVTPSAEGGFSVYGEATQVGSIDGLSPFPRSTFVGISNPASAAAKAGFKSGDEILEFDHKKIQNWEELESLFDRTSAGTAIQIRGKHSDGVLFDAQLVKPAAYQVLNPLGSAWGLYSSELFVEKTVPSSPAEKGGVRKGDRLIGVGNREVQSFTQLREAVQSAAEKMGKVDLRWEREGQVISASLNPSATETRDPLMKKVIQYTVGVVPMLVVADPVYFTERIFNPVTLVAQAVERMAILTSRNFISIGKMITGEVSTKTLGGPILIGKIAGESLSRGLISFLTTMGILSIGLGVLNILPIPVLDGGHILILLFESIRRRPLTLKQLERVQSFGLALVLMLMGIVLFNDLARISPF